MTPQDATLADGDADLAVLPEFAAAGATVRLLVQLGTMQVLLLTACVLADFAAGRSPAFDDLLHAGAPRLIGGALVTSLTGTLCCLLLAWGRSRASQRVTRLAGAPQAILVLAGAASSAWVLRHVPRLPAPDPAIGGAGLAGLLLVPAFALMVCERLAKPQPPDGGRLAALLRLPVLMLLALAALVSARSFGLAPPAWSGQALALLLMAVDAELVVRTLGVWFQPLAAPERARAAIGSVIAALLQPGGWRAGGVAQRLRAQLGIDISRSWAVLYARRALPPVVLSLLLLAWGLTGVARIGLGERGSYERFGAPVAVLKPGLHLMLPWPFGQVRRLEFGAVHSVPVGVPVRGSTVAIDRSTADGPAPASANRLWDERPGADISYLIAGRSGARESFETVSVDVRVLYRIGLDDSSARRALYGVADPDQLVRALSGRRLAQFFADRTLTQVLGERREQVAEGLQIELQAELDRDRSGLEVVAVVVESMHPPGGAAAAYRGVQAAQIVASTRRAEETGRAHGTLEVAARDAHDVRARAQGLAAEVVGAAEMERTQAEADAVAYRDGGRAFLLERYFGNLRMALARSALEIIDNRLPAGDRPILDLRSAMDGAHE